jgi:hypothetical protein
MAEANSRRKLDLVVRQDDLTVTARDLARIIANGGRFFDRAGPVEVLPSADGRLPEVRQMSVDRIVVVAHELARPVKTGDEPRPVTLPDRAARLYLALQDWGLQPLKGVTTAPLLSADGSMRVVEGYDPTTALWCCNFPRVDLPEEPSVADAQAALKNLRLAFRTFPFADSAMDRGPYQAVPHVDQSTPPGQDESAFLVALMTAVCRPSLPLAPGLLINAPFISGAGSGKGLLVRAICKIAFDYAPHALHSSYKIEEFEKRIGAALIEAAPVLLLDNVNAAPLRGDLLVLLSHRDDR